ncbi:signal peptidase II [Liquorilactobacillus mali]|uniref:Lipoprotein signal peptidase n=1 Tax=Liquorilactobacillus mali KCTC 3596 = DSM 20444 TaxID=1046596 RepID=J1F4I4_9LACO|nr:signal peptidase II [Liquorilactobacillus mali]EJF00791.1 lipoprotein signal peptidase [Liquorilactobacillus mali KCTC 3596 = DSM 20444]KRN09204.1 lipoprotein signal peptidase [Liquorilactobacillus mali KCTC 3596 = DSM 20444]MDC7952276.1 signal peptidase II [Liquorilactobacillus mali]QFQ74369.1 signal peptidase II [Liquorilactobacillus mali]
MALYIFLIFAVILLDQIVKLIVVSSIPLDSSVQFIPSVLSVAHIRNYGAAWNIFTGQKWFLFLITIIALGVLVYLFLKLWKNWVYALGISLMIGGTLGNFIDRIRIGYVVDMLQLDFINFPIFNVADSALSIGVVVIIIAMLRDDKND